MVETRNQIKRKRGDSETKEYAVEVEKLLDRQDLSPSTREDAEDLYNKILSKTKGESLGELKTSFRLLEKSASKSNRIKDLIEAKGEDNHRRWLLEVGDWCAAILNCAKAQELKSAEKDSKNFRTEQETQGVPSKVLGPLCQKVEAWRALGDQVQGFLPKVKAEIETVKRWREDGEGPSTLPQTPCLARLDRVYTDMNDEMGPAKLTPEFFLKVIETYDARNQLAHSPPPRPEFFFSREKSEVDWAEVWYECKQKRKQWSDMHKQGKFSREEFAFGDQISRIWYDCHVKTWLKEDGGVPEGQEGPELTNYGKKQMGQVEKKIHKSRWRRAAVSLPKGLHTGKMGQMGAQEIIPKPYALHLKALYAWMSFQE